MTEQEMISVILPVRDGDGALLRLALESVRGQTNQNYEILLVDDGSEAAFAEQLDGLAGDNARIRLFHRENSGVSAARNFALGEAKGEIITFLDADDVLSPVCFEEAVSLLRNSDADALWGETRFFTDAERSGLPSPESVKAFSPEELEKRTIPLTEERLPQSVAELIGEPLRFEGGYINRGIAARFLRRELFAGGMHRFPLGIRLYEDTIWNLELLQSARIVLVKSIWYYYYDNSASASNRFQPELRTEMEASLRRIREQLAPGNPTEYAAYTRFLMDSLRYVYRCCCGHPAWMPAPQERRDAFRALYREEPWREIGTRRYLRFSAKRDRQKALLYRLHLLFAFWRRKI